LPRYFFRLRGASEGVNDPDGEEFENDAAARNHVTVSIRMMLEEGSRTSTDYVSLVFDVMNEEGQLIATVPFNEVIHLSPGEQDLP